MGLSKLEAGPGAKVRKSRPQRGTPQARGGTCWERITEVTLRFFRDSTALTLDVSGNYLRTGCGGHTVLTRTDAVLTLGPGICCARSGVTRCRGTPAPGCWAGQELVESPRHSGPRSRARKGAGAMRDRNAAGDRARPEGGPLRCRPCRSVPAEGSSHLWGQRSVRKNKEVPRAGRERGPPDRKASLCPRPTVIPETPNLLVDVGGREGLCKTAGKAKPDQGSISILKFGSNKLESRTRVSRVLDCAAGGQLVCTWG